MSQSEATKRFASATADLRSLRRCFSKTTGRPKWWNVFWKSPFGWFPYIFKTDGNAQLFDAISSKAADILRADCVDSAARIGDLRKELETLKIKTLATTSEETVQARVHSKLVAEADAVAAAKTPQQFAQAGASFNDLCVRNR